MPTAGKAAEAAGCIEWRTHTANTPTTNSSRYQSGGSGNIKAISIITAGTNDFENVHASFTFSSVVTHSSGAARDRKSTRLNSSHP